MTDTVILPDSTAKTLDDIDPHLDLEAEIDRLRKEKNAVILAHYYQDGEIQDLADFVGDSLDLSRKAAATDADMIVFSGVRFMAEVAKVLSPEKTVVIPDAEAGCSLEDSCQAEAFKTWRDAHPGHISLTYINCSAEVKALSDVIVTSSSAEHIIKNLPEDQPVLFAPDRHLGAYLERKTGRKMVLWPGTCIVHEQFSAREISRLKTQNPGALVAAHPECPESILEVSDHVGSTSQILNFVDTNPAKQFIVATETHIIHQMEKANPDKTFLPAPGADGGCDCGNCPYMELNTLEKIYLAMVNETPAITMDEDLRARAQKPLDRMLELAPAANPSQSAA
ncbi:quinolinate synthase NadA [Magnetovibrio sp. PR-2]|uniref:quinolinate synthase NadA n=1 Tax=Magnetovibrio sp. PR-2 TaxID=3120356 RepID=UPI002FCE381C